MYIDHRFFGGFPMPGILFFRAFVNSGLEKRRFSSGNRMYLVVNQASCWFVAHCFCCCLCSIFEVLTRHFWDFLVNTEYGTLCYWSTSIKEEGNAHTSTLLDSLFQTENRTLAQVFFVFVFFLLVVLGLFFVFLHSAAPTHHKTFHYQKEEKKSLVEERIIFQEMEIFFWCFFG